MNRIARSIGRRTPLPRAVAAWLWLSALSLFAADPILITSVSTQFVVRGQPQRSMLAANAREDFAYLDPSTLAVTAERVKRALTHELGWGDRWRGIIYLNIRPVRGDNHQPDIIVFRSDRGWSYRVDLPDEISRARLLETLVQALVLEFAGRSATNQNIELPPWLIEGLTAHLSQGPLLGVALQARTLQQISDNPQWRAARDMKHIDVDQALRGRLQQNGALTVDQLNWPEFGDFDPVAEDAYHHSAHLFVRELLRMPGGPDALCAMMALLPSHLNWQTAFLRAFEPYFARMLDVEKWWSLTVSQWKAHDSPLHWSNVEARRRLDEILYTSIQTPGPDDVPRRATPVALQTLLQELAFPQQLGLLQTKLQQLQMMQIHCTPEMATLVGGYQAALATYLESRGKGGRWFTERRARAAVDSAMAALNALDFQRSRLAAGHRSSAPLQTGHSSAGSLAKPLSAWSEPRPGITPLRPD